MATPSATASAFPSNPSTPNYVDDTDWIAAYLTIHYMSPASRRYGYLMWIVVVFVFLIFALLHWTGSKGGFIGASWSKWSLRRRTWRKKHSLAVARRRNQPHRQPLSLPSNAQLLCLFVLLLATIALSVAGPDYIAPGLKVWQFDNHAPLEDPTSLDGPQYTIWKAWWTEGGRTGLIAFALLPLCVLFALKAPPFAIFAVPFMIQLYSDKLAWLHRWSGRLIWLMSTAHVALWVVQMVIERRPSTGKIVLKYAWLEMKFIWGWIAFGVLTLVILFSIHPLRRTHYEAFYFLHILLVPLFLISAAFHHPPVWWWCWAALGLWIGERIWRATWWLHTNGYFGGMLPSSPANRDAGTTRRQDHKGEAWEMKHFNPEEQLVDSPAYPFPSPRQSHTPYSQHQPSHSSPLSPLADQRPPYPSHGHSTIPSLHHATSSSVASSFQMPPSSSVDSYVPPPGYAHAELLAGRVIRLRFLSPGFISWAPGQHFLITIPSVSRFTTHPFTVASVCDERGPDSGRIIVFLVRAKNGWTLDLWDKVSQLLALGQSHPRNEHPPRGVDMPSKGILMRMYIDGPFGSSVRARWGTHPTVLIIAGGSGVSFGLSVLEYVCMCLSGRDGKHLGGRPGGWGKKGFMTSRVRFVWLVREFCHIQWCATTLRRCMAMVPAPGLQIDIFVTNFKPLLPHRHNDFPQTPSSQSKDAFDTTANDLVPPTPGFARDAKQHSRNDSVESVDSVEDDSANSYVDLSYYTGDLDDEVHHQEEQELGDFGLDHEGHILDLTNFDGDNDEALPGEDALNRTVKKQGKLRRAKTRKVTRATTAARDRLHERRERRAQSRPPVANDHPPRDAYAQSHNPALSRDSALSTDRLLSYPTPSAATIQQRLSTTIEVDLGSPTASYSELPWRVPQTQSPPPMSPETSRHGNSEGHFNNWDSRSDTTSIREMMPQKRVDAGGDEVRLEIEGQEMRDVNVVSEHARPGKPKLDRIVADEVENSKGSMIVACCGPTSLNAMVRKIIASKIDPSRIRRGDMRGAIALVSEEFEY